MFVAAGIVAFLTKRGAATVGSGRSRQTRTATIGWSAALTLAALPLLFDEVTVYNAGLLLIFIVAALGLHLLVNWAGQLSLAHAGMVGLPALVVIALSANYHVSPLYLLPVGVLVGAGTGVLVALPAMRAQGLQIALVTLTAGIAINRFFLHQRWLIGEQGSRAAAVPSLGPFEFRTSKDLYLPLLLVVAAALGLFTALMRSKLGRSWLWMAADPTAASAFGVPITTYKIAAYGVAGAFAGLAGALMVSWVRQLSPQAFPTTLSFTYLLAAVLAGSGFAGGVVVAGLVIAGGPLFFSSTSSEVNRLISYLGPVALVLNLTIYKAGFNGAGRNLMEKLSGSSVLTRASFGRNGASRGEPEGDATPASRRPVRNVSLGLIGGVTAILAGFVAIALAWYHSGNTRQLWIQNQELISGGFGGIALVVLGVGLLIRDQLQQRDALLPHYLEELVKLRNTAEGAASEVASPTEPVARTPRRRRPTVVKEPAGAVADT
jgi:branched-chain amino acid transport system permease protein